MNKEKILEIFKRFHKHNPHPSTELHFRSHFELLTAVILSAQATDSALIKQRRRYLRSPAHRKKCRRWEKGIKILY